MRILRVLGVLCALASIGLGLSVSAKTVSAWNDDMGFRRGITVQGQPNAPEGTSGEQPR